MFSIQIYLYLCDLHVDSSSARKFCGLPRKTEECGCDKGLKKDPFGAASILMRIGMDHIAVSAT